MDIASRPSVPRDACLLFIVHIRCQCLAPLASVSTSDLKPLDVLDVKCVSLNDNP